MAERELAILLRAKDLASKTIRGVKSEISSLGKIGGRAMSGLSTAIRNVGIASAVGLVGAISLGVRALGDLQRTEAQTNAVIESTGGKAGVSAGEVRKYATELEALTTVDDKVIQDGENMLLTFTGIGKKTFPLATKAALNMAVAMAKGDVANVDMQASAIQLGKALNDPIKGITALRKVGVAFTDQQQDQIKALVKAGKMEEAQAVILRELEVEFGKAGEAAGTGFEADMRRVQDAGEDATQALARGVMPALTRVTRWLSTKLADPAVLAAIDEIGRGLGDAAMSALDFIESVDFKSIGEGLRIAATAAGGIVSAFMAMPEWVKVAVVTGWGLNKLTGGAVGGIIGELSKGLIKGVLGMNAGVVNINAGVVNGAGGGAPGVPGGPAAAAGAGGLLGLGLTGAALIGAIQFGAQKALGAATIAVTGSTQVASKAEEISPMASSAFGPPILGTLEQIQRVLAGDNRSLLERIADSEAHQGPDVKNLGSLLATRLERLKVASDRTKDDTVAAIGGAATRAIATANAVAASRNATTVSTANAIRDRVESARIASLSGAASIAAATAAAGSLVKGSVDRKDLSVTSIFSPSIKLTVSLKETINTTTTYKKYQRTLS